MGNSQLITPMALVEGRAISLIAVSVHGAATLRGIYKEGHLLGRAAYPHVKDADIPAVG